jgi:low temperature requirement protein LtrA
MSPAIDSMRGLRARGEGTQPVTTAELFFDLVYVFAVTQLSGLILHDLSVGGVVHATFLLLVVWWAWIYTTWMANWFDPASPGVLAVLAGAMFASLLMAAALPEAFGERGLLFAASYVALQVGRNAAAVLLLPREHPLRDVFKRLAAWSVASGVLWLAGGAVAGDQRLILWLAALAVELAAPAAGYWLPNRGRTATTDWDIEGGHFVERCQLFVLIALGESIVVTGATAASAGLTFAVVVCLVVAFLEMAALWWLYFGGHAERSHDVMTTCDDPGRLARDAYTYGHLPIVAGIIATAVGLNLLIAAPHRALHPVGIAMVLGGPALYLLGESHYRWRISGTYNVKGITIAGVFLLLAPIGHGVSTLLLSVLVAALLTLLAVWQRHEVGDDPIVSARRPGAGPRARPLRTSRTETESPGDHWGPEQRQIHGNPT